jgi:hypothetical protein
MEGGMEEIEKRGGEGERRGRRRRDEKEAERE